MKKRHIVIGAGLSIVAWGAAALSLGPSPSTVILGAPIDLRFEIALDPGMDLADACLRARLFDGDVPLSDSLVRVTPVAARAGHSPAVRVQAFAPAREPVLTATLSAGCGGAVTRSYTFLAEPPLAARASQAPLDLARLAPAGAPAQATGALRAERGARPSAHSSALAATPAAPAPAKPRPAVRKSSPVPNPLPSVRERLVMEPLEFFSAPSDALRLSPELPAAPSAADTPSAEDSARRAQAAALWQVLRSEPQALVQQLAAQEQVERLGRELAAAQGDSRQAQADLAALRQELERAQQERFEPALVYGLGGAVVLLLGLLAWSWRRGAQRQGPHQRAWRDSVAHAVALGQTSVPAAPASAAAAVPAWADETPTLPHAHRAPTLPTSAPVPAPAYEPVVSTQPMWDEPAFVPDPAPASAAPSATMEALNVPQLVNPEELFDILQQAEFFISVGEHEQAIAVLRQHIAERGETSPFSCLELLRLYHQLGRAEDFELLRTQFMRRFNADVPPFARFAAQGRGLLHYTDALAEVEAQWTSASVLALLEGYLFLQEGRSASVPAFDLAAYDDLLLLLAIAQTTPASARGKPAGERLRTTPLGPPTPVLPEVAPVAPDWGQASSEPPRPVAAQTLDFLLDDLALQAYTDPAPLSAAASALDVDLSAPPPITLSELPDVPPTPAPAPGQAVGFGSSDDKFELRLELEQAPSPRAPR